MGRRGSFRGRCGFLTVILFAACLTTFYLSWQFLTSSNNKKEDYMQMQNSLDYNNQPKERQRPNEEVPSKSHGQINENSLGNVLVFKTHITPHFQQQETVAEKELSDKYFNLKESTRTPKQSETPSFQDRGKKLYHQPHRSIVETVTSMEKYVHLDLKGAPPKMYYLQLFIRLVKRLGATGLLIEYEDMFPYTGLLESIRSGNAYSNENIRELIEFAEKADLTVMPLIPTFGHMEFVLKSKFSELRNRQHTPQVIDITRNYSYRLISEMIKQILYSHPGATHLHIGCDEVRELGTGASATEMQRKNLSASQMFLRHVVRVASIVREHNSNVTPVIWDEHLRRIHFREMQDSGISSLIEIMVRESSSDVHGAISKEVWYQYASVFASVWIASSFKGSTGAGQIFTEPKHHLENHLSWLDVIAAYNKKLVFRGIALTGWQRYDHFSTLCELLPVAVPSLAVCLATMVNGGFTKDIHLSTSQLISCKHPIELNSSIHQQDVVKDCIFPGDEVYYAVKELQTLKVSGSNINKLVEGWLSDYQLAHAFSNPDQLEILNTSLTEQKANYSRLSAFLERYMSIIYTEDTVKEWIEANIQARLRHINSLLRKVQSLQHITSWPNRPLSSDDDKRENAIYDDNVKRENDYQGQEVESGTSKLLFPEAQSQNAPLVIWKTDSSRSDTDKFASISQNQANRFQEKPSNMESNKEERVVRYKPPYTRSDSESRHKDTLTNSQFADNITEQPQLRSTDSSMQEPLHKGVTDDMTDKGVADNMTDKGITENMTDKDVTDSITDKGVTSSTTDKGVTDSTIDKGVTGSFTDKGVTGSTTHKGVTDSTTDKGAGSTTDKGVTDSTTDKGVTDSTIDKGVTGSTTDKAVTDNTTDKGVADSTTDKGVTDNNTSLYILSESLSNSMDKNITFLQNNVIDEDNTNRSQILTSANMKSLLKQELLNVGRSRDSLQVEMGIKTSMEYQEAVKNETEKGRKRSNENDTHNSTGPIQTTV